MQAQNQLIGLEAVRRRPGMYIGGTDQKALNECVMQLLGNSLREHVAGRGSIIVVTIHDDGTLSVRDRGGGISVAVDPIHNLPYLERALTTLCGFRPQAVPYVFFDQLGIGAKCVNALSEWMQITTVWENITYHIEFRYGRTSSPLVKLQGESMSSGTIVHFKPDSQIFKVTKFDHRFLFDRLTELAFLHPKLELWLVDETPNGLGRPLVSRFGFSAGIADYLRAKVPPYPRSWSSICTFVFEGEGIRLAVGFQYTDEVNTSIESIVNCSPRCTRGTHVQGFLLGLVDAFNSFGKRRQPLKVHDIDMGLSAVVAVWLSDPKYSGSTKHHLFNPEVKRKVRKVTSSYVKSWIASLEGYHRNDQGAIEAPERWLFTKRRH